VLNNRAAVIDDGAASYRELESRTESLASKARQPALTVAPKWVTEG
jgi:hypothetical protein